MEADICNEATRLLARLIQIETVNDPRQDRRPGLREASLILEDLKDFGVRGFEIIADSPSPILFKKIGEGRPVQLYLAHYDVVPPGPGWTRDPFSGVIEKGRIYGRGAADDKSNITSISLALRDFRPEKGTLLIAFTGDEETGGESAKWLADKLEVDGLLPDFLINGDGSLERIIIRRRNAFNALISVDARRRKNVGRLVKRRFLTRILLRETMHSAYFIPGVDTHALVAASLWLRDNELEAVGLEGEWVKSNVIPRSVVLTAFQADRRGEHIYVDEGLTDLLKSLVPLVRTPIYIDLYSDYGVTINPNMYSFENGKHKLLLDIRAMTKERRRIKQALEYVLESTIGPGRFQLTITGGGGYLYTPPTAIIVKKALQAAKLSNISGNLVEAGGASDSRYFSPRGVESIDFGPRGFNIHGPDESVDVASLCRSIKFYRTLAEILGRG